MGQSLNHTSTPPLAGAVLGSVPVVILYVFFLDYYVSGLTAGAVKEGRGGA